MFELNISAEFRQIAIHWNRLRGAFSLRDPRPIALEAPYTFFLPKKPELNALSKGDFVKICFCDLPQSEVGGAERMWVEITHRDGDKFVGTLESSPVELTQILPGDRIRFCAFHIYDVDSQDCVEFSDIDSDEDRFFELCLVDKLILDGKRPVSFIYREAPMPPNERRKARDSGWRIRCDFLEGDEEAVEFVALGVVLNKDDSWLHLIGEPTGSAFIREHGTSDYRKTDAPIELE
jgi:hypothetical protein